jgi:hypothetical protein
MAALAAGVACSSSSSSAPSGNNNTANDSGGGGTNDSSVATDDGSEPSDSGSTPIPSILCGSNTCKAVTGIFPLQPCCLPGDKCGATFGAASFANFDASAYLSTFDASGFDASSFDASDFDASAICFDTSAGTPDTTCPSSASMGFTLAGCCTSDGVCGVNLSTVGLGCNSLSALSMYAPADAAVAAPQACGSAVDSGGTEAGTSDGATP